LRNALGRSDEEVLETATEVEYGTGEDCANSLKDKESRAGIDVCVGLAFESKAKRDKKYESEREILQTLCHVSSSWTGV
jgi:hypothetical protein